MVTKMAYLWHTIPVLVVSQVSAVSQVPRCHRSSQISTLNKCRTTQQKSRCSKYNSFKSISLSFVLQQPLFYNLSTTRVPQGCGKVQPPYGHLFRQQCNIMIPTYFTLPHPGMLIRFTVPLLMTVALLSLVHSKGCSFKSASAWSFTGVSFVS